jgi:hypothetical protein
MRLGKVIFTAKGGLTSGIPVYSPRDGIVNVQYTINDVSSEATGLTMESFVIEKMFEAQSFNKWMLLDSDPLNFSYFSAHPSLQEDRTKINFKNSKSQSFAEFQV